MRPGVRLALERRCDRLGRDPAGLVNSSRMSAKVDSAAVQDGYQIYHHLFLFTREGSWGSFSRV